MSEKPIVPTDCFFQGCYNPAYEEQIRIGKEKCYRFNQLCPNDREKQQEILSELLGGMGKDVIVTPPFWCDYGYFPQCQKRSCARSPFGTQALLRRNARAGFDTSDTHLVVRLYHLKSL